MADYTAYQSARTQSARSQRRRVAWRNVNRWAAASLLFSVLWLYGLGSALGIVAAVIALKKTRSDGGPGRALSSRLAVAGLVAGMIGLAAILALGLAQSFNAVTSIGHQHR